MGLCNHHGITGQASKIGIVGAYHFGIGGKPRVGLDKVCTGGYGFLKRATGVFRESLGKSPMRYDEHVRHVMSPLDLSGGRPIGGRRPDRLSWGPYCCSDPSLPGTGCETDSRMGVIWGWAGLRSEESGDPIFSGDRGWVWQRSGPLYTDERGT